MGMYTEFVASFHLRPDAPPIVEKTLVFMLGNDLETPDPPELPSHALFKSFRWRYMLRTSSHYFANSDALSARVDSDPSAFAIWCSLKNYGSEIEAFVDWIAPYVDDVGDGEPLFLGYSRYEECQDPTLYFLALVDGVTKVRPVSVRAVG